MRRLRVRSRRKHSGAAVGPGKEGTAGSRRAAERRKGPDTALVHLGSVRKDLWR